MKDHNLAQDVVQETFLKAYRLTYQQLAAYQKTSISAVKSRIYRAKMKFRSLIQDAGMSC